MFSNLEEMQVALLRNAIISERAVVASVAIVMCDVDTAKDMLQRYSNELDAQTRAELQALVQTQQ